MFSHGECLHVDMTESGDWDCHDSIGLYEVIILWTAFGASMAENKPAFQLAESDTDSVAWDARRRSKAVGENSLKCEA